MLMTKAQAMKWLDNSEGRQYNPDRSYGFQCYDYANAYFMAVTGEHLYGLYAKISHLIMLQQFQDMANQLKTMIRFYHKKEILQYFLVVMVVGVDTSPLFDKQRLINSKY